MQSLEAAQLPAAVIAEVVTQVVAPVVAMTPMPEDMDMSGAGPGTRMGPGTAVQSEDMPVVLNAGERVREWKEERRQIWLQDPFQHPMDSVDSKDLEDMQEK